MTNANLPWVQQAESVVPAEVSGWLDELSEQVRASVTSAVTESVLKAQLPEVIESLIKQAQSHLEANPPVPSLSDFAHADARNRAFGTLVNGILISGAWGALSAVGSASGINWFDHNAWPSLLALVAGTVVTSVGNYLSRILGAPSHQVAAGVAAITPTQTRVRRMLGIG